MPIAIKNLSYVYNEGTPFAVRALDGITLSINAGEFVGIIGQTGSGKSTLIQHMNGLIRPALGQVFVAGQDLADPKTNLKAVRQRVGLVFQYPEHQLFEETVFKDVAFGPTNQKLSPEEIEQRVVEALTWVGLDPDEFKDRSPFELSGGQMRRVAIAGVLAMRPQVLILDEPTAGLDPRGRDELLDQLSTLHAKSGMTIILVSHSMDEIARVATRLVVLEQGQIVADGPPRQVFSNAKKLAEIGLGVPQVTELMIALRQRGLAVPPVALTVEEAKQAILALLDGGQER
ncbi:MAG: energy-coupling factor transporter ATPase [Firmicutes bacterium]|nr:energy-coupling factor transporter ATPase [Bacillota bacterium]